ncbi:hypothetical protein [Flavobacterium sp. '19STA2R22 D10 B1']|uniref:hypothetical protein n=1 Tax=Flavobacterium aerium TaxID=3037261 RepID=UPI00278BDF89|nr:hypothetical protein [Flavobacterium sp. '19STA2R22 D10 B1']
MATSLNTILNWFKTGKKPTQAQFWASWQSFWHKDEVIPQDKINGLQTSLNSKLNKSSLTTNIIPITNSNNELIDSTITKDSVGNYYIETPLLSLKNAQINSTQLTGSVKLNFSWLDHIGAGIEGYKITKNTSGLKFYTEYGYNVQIERMRLTNGSGKLMLGNDVTTMQEDASRLQVEGSASFTGIIDAIGGVNLSGQGLNIGNGFVTAYNSNFGGWNFAKLGITDGIFFIKDNSFVGIGTVNPSEKFVVSNNGAESFEIALGNHSGYVHARAYNRETQSYSPLLLDGLKIILGISGNVIIGSKNDNGEKFQVNGNMAVYANEGREILAFHTYLKPIDTMISGHSFKWYDHQWKAGITRGNSINTIGYDIMLDDELKFRVTPEGGGHFLSTVKGANALEPNEFVTKQQLDNFFPSHLSDQLLISKNEAGPFPGIRIENTNNTGATACTSIDLVCQKENELGIIGQLLATSNQWQYGTYLQNQTNLTGSGIGGIAIRTTNAPISFYQGNLDPDNSPLVAGFKDGQFFINNLPVTVGDIITVGQDGKLGKTTLENLGIPTVIKTTVSTTALTIPPGEIITMARAINGVTEGDSIIFGSPMILPGTIDAKAYATNNHVKLILSNNGVSAFSIPFTTFKITVLK